MIDVASFVLKIAKPIFLFNMAKMHENLSPAQKQSAETRRQNAAEEIEQLVLEYAEVIRKREEER